MTYRTRTRGALPSATGTNTQLYYNAGPSSYSTSGQRSGKYEIMEDYVTTGFLRKQRNGELVNSPMVKTITTATNTVKPSKWMWDRTSGTWQTGQNMGFEATDPIGLRFGSLEFPEHKLPQWNSNLAGVALASARESAARPESQLLVTLGEARETLNMIGGALDVLRNRVTPFLALQRRYYRGQLTYKDFLAEFANLWLLGRYGIMPLVYDIQGYINALTKSHKPVRNTARAAGSDSGTITWTVTGSSSMIASVALDWELTYTDNYRATCVYEYKDDLQARLGLRLADVPVALWELKHLSFVYDWFINLGSFLGSLTLAGRADVRLQCVSRFLVAQATATYRESGSVTWSTFKSRMDKDGSGSKVSFVLTRKQRTPYNTYHPGVLTPRLALSWKRLLDGASLLATSMDISNRKSRIVRI